MAKKRKKTGKKKGRKKISARRRKLIGRKISATKLRNNARKKMERLLESKNPIHYKDEIKRLEKEIEIRNSIISDRKSTRLNSSHIPLSRMPSSA